MFKKLTGVVLGPREGLDAGRSRERFLHLVAVALLLASVAIGIGAVETSLRIGALLTRGVSSEARIVGFQAGLDPGAGSRPGPGDRRSSMPILEFTLPQGRPMRVVSGIGTSLTLGSTVRVRYDPRNPLVAEVDSLWNLSFLFVWPWVMTLAMAAMGLLFWRIARRGGF